MEKFKIEKINNGCGWFIGAIDYPYGYLWHDLTIHSCDTGGQGGSGYYATKAEAERYLKAYEVRQMNFQICQGIIHPERGWFIISNEKYKQPLFIWLDLELHKTTGWGAINHYPTSPPGTAPGYYGSQSQAEHFLKLFKEKHTMIENNIKINVESNGKPLPLHELSVESILAIREASKPKPKPVPVFQVANFLGGSRLIFKVTKNIASYVGNYVALDDRGFVSRTRQDGDETMSNDYENVRELKLEDV